MYPASHVFLHTGDPEKRSRLLHISFFYSIINMKKPPCSYAQDFTYNNRITQRIGTVKPAQYLRYTFTKDLIFSSFGPFPCLSDQSTNIISLIFTREQSCLSFPFLSKPFRRLLSTENMLKCAICESMVIIPVLTCKNAMMFVFWLSQEYVNHSQLV